MTKNILTPVKNGEPLDRLELDQIATILGAHTLQAHCGAAKFAAPPRRGLEPWQKLRTEEIASYGRVALPDSRDIHITSAQVGAVHFAGDAISAPSTSKEIYILLSVELTNISTTHKLDYESWNESTGVGPNSTVLTDNFGNNYRSIPFSAGDNIVGAESYGSIYPGKSLHDVLVFERPLDNVSYLDLELPANYFKGEGKIRLRIPKSMIQFDNPPAK